MVKNEIEILKITDHPNIVKVYEFSEDEKDLNIIMEYCEGGELFEYISKKGTFTEGMACKIIKQIFSALSYLHSNNIIHSDLKPENIMFYDKDAKDLHVKIIDFGMATKFNPDEKLSNINGTPYYLAPEVLRREYSSKADIWS
jgi:calcium-dependent protein kinase